MVITGPGNRLPPAPHRPSTYTLDVREGGREGGGRQGEGGREEVMKEGTEGGKEVWEGGREVKGKQGRK